MSIIPIGKNPILCGMKMKKELRGLDKYFKIKVGDTYIIHDIMMPEVYVKKVEKSLGKKAQEYLDRYRQPKVEYRVISDYVWLRKTRWNSL
ncbi:MAG: hypothetical protein ACMUEM_02490 [Flavobacteriales bacterium AspAUS03]